jgi:hypothetical protein
MDLLCFALHCFALLCFYLLCFALLCFALLSFYYRPKASYANMNQERRPQVQ